MAHYLDTSVVVALLLRDIHSPKANAWLIKVSPEILVSDFCAAEFAAVVSRRTRTKALTVTDANRALAEFDHWRSNVAQVVHCASEHIAAAERSSSNFDTKLNAPDAIHLAMARHLEAILVTFDQRLAEAARNQNASVVIPDYSIDSAAHAVTSSASYTSSGAG